MNKLLILALILTVSSCSMFCPKPDVIYEDKIVTVYPTLLQPVTVVDTEISIYDPGSEYITFNMSKDNTSFVLHPDTYGFKTFKRNGKIIDVVLVDSLHFAEMTKVFNVLMSNHIFTKKFLKLYKIQYNKIEEDKDLQ